MATFSRLRTSLPLHFLKQDYLTHGGPRGRHTSSTCLRSLSSPWQFSWVNTALSLRGESFQRDLPHLGCAKDVCRQLLTVSLHASLLLHCALRSGIHSPGDQGKALDAPASACSSACSAGADASKVTRYSMRDDFAMLWLDPQATTNCSRLFVEPSSRQRVLGSEFLGAACHLGLTSRFDAALDRYGSIRPGLSQASIVVKASPGTYNYEHTDG
jgi:hypothetical protein